jgi:hypothetical protein
MWTVHFQSRKTSAEDDERPKRHSSDDFSAAISCYLERNSYDSCCEIAKGLFVPETTNLQALGEMGFRFFVAR